VILIIKASNVKKHSKMSTVTLGDVTSHDENAERSRCAPVCVNAPAASFYNTVQTTTMIYGPFLGKPYEPVAAITLHNQQSTMAAMKEDQTCWKQVLPPLIITYLFCRLFTMLWQSGTDYPSDKTCSSYWCFCVSVEHSYFHIVHLHNIHLSPHFTTSNTTSSLCLAMIEPD